MKTNIEADEKIIADIIRMSEARNQKQAIEKSIKNYIQYLHKLRLLESFGKIKWEGNLDQMRSL